MAACYRDIVQFCRDIPKVELHAHLNGSISVKTMNKLYKDYNESHKQNHYIDKCMVAMTKGENRTMEECFQIFGMIHKLVDNIDAVAMVIKDVIEEFNDDGVYYLELRSTPRDVPTTGMTKRQYIDTVLLGIQQCQQAGINTIVRDALNDRQEGICGWNQDGSREGICGWNQDGSQKGIYGESEDGSQEGICGESEDGSQEGICGESQDGSQEGICGESQDGSQEGICGESEDGSQKGICGESEDGSQEGIYGESEDGSQEGICGESEDGSQEGICGESQDGSQEGICGESQDGSQKGICGESEDGSQEGMCGESHDGSQEGICGESEDGSQGGICGESEDGSQERIYSHVLTVDASHLISVLKYAKDRGLKIAIHIAEVASMTDDEALLQILPDRIGHGTCLHPDYGGSDHLVSLMKEYQKPL
uniref:Uncharacterized protein LOC102802231 n=1 Tax=Saccoglossus kowalevskii TaxID=10224 RepID=A0ABM0MCJ3_SACKO